LYRPERITTGNEGKAKRGIKGGQRAQGQKIANKRAVWYVTTNHEQKTVHQEYW